LLTFAQLVGFVVVEFVVDGKCTLLFEASQAHSLYKRFIIVNVHPLQ
jgi:hypothetical protein